MSHGIGDQLTNTVTSYLNYTGTDTNVCVLGFECLINKLFRYAIPNIIKILGESSLLSLVQLTCSMINSTVNMLVHHSLHSLSNRLLPFGYRRNVYKSFPTVVTLHRICFNVHTLYTSGLNHLAGLRINLKSTLKSTDSLVL